MIPGIVAARRPAASGAGHRYWRVRCTKSQTFFALTQLQMRDSGGFDHAPDGTVTASSVYGTPYQPGYAVNGLSYQFWSTGDGQGGNGWIAVDFGTAREITSVLMSNLSASRYPRAFNVEWSDDGASWSIAWSGTMADQAAGYAVSTAAGTTVSATGGQRFRIRADAVPAGGYTEFAEMLFYDQDGRPIVMSRGISSSNFSGYNPSRLFDGDAATQWATAKNTEQGAWAGLIAADDRDRTISSVTLTAGPGSEYSRSPTNFSIQKSSDGGATWVTLWSVVGATWSSGGQVQTFDLPDSPGTSTPAASWSDPGGAGDRSAMIAVSTTMALGAGDISTLVDGLGADNLFFADGQTGDGTKWIKFDFGAGVKKVIREFNWIAGSNGHGVWAFEGSNDDATWTAIVRNFTLSAGRVGSASHDVGYRYYRLRHMSGTTSSTPWLHEIRFKLVDVSFEENPATSYSNAGGTGDRTSIITVTGTNVGTPTPLVDGSQSNNWWTGNAGSIVFDFGSAKVVDEFIWYQDEALTNGHDSLFTWEGSNDNTTFDMINNHVVLGTELATLCRVPTETAYRYYRLAGDFSSSPYNREIEFKISA